MIIKNAKVYSDGCRFVEKDLIIRDGRIVFGAAPLEGEDVIDAGGAYALPGLVDIHFHGAVGHDFCDADAAGAGQGARAPDGGGRAGSHHHRGAPRHGAAP